MKIHAGATSLKRLFLVLVVPAVLVVLIYLGLLLWGQHEWAQAQAELQAKGEKLDFRDLIPPDVPAAENFFASPLWQEEADMVEEKGSEGQITHVPRLAEEKRRAYAIEDALGGKNRDKVSFTTDPASLGKPLDLAELAERFRKIGRPVKDGIPPAFVIIGDLNRALPAMGEIRQDAEKTGASFPSHWEDGYFMNQLQIGTLGIVSQYVYLRAVAEAELGRGGAVQREVGLLLQLADTIKDQPSPFAQSLRLSVVNAATGVIWEGLYRQCWNEEQIQQLRISLSKVSFRDGYILALRGERALFVQFLRPLAESPQNFFQINREIPPSFASLFQFFPKGILLDDLAFYCRTIQERIDAAKQNRMNVVEPSGFNSPLPGGHIFSRNLLPSPNLGQFFLYTETRLKMADAALNLESDRLKNGKYPSVLSGAPLDPVKRKQFYYSREKEGYRIESAGIDRNSVHRAWIMPGRPLSTPPPPAASAGDSSSPTPVSAPPGG